MSSRVTHHQWPGVPLALGSAVLFGASTPVSKALLGVIDPWLLAGILYLGAGVGLLTLTLIRRLMRLERAEAPITRPEIPWLLAVVLLGGLVGPVLLMFGLRQTTASTGSLLLNLEGMATLAIAWIAFRESVDRRLLLGAAAIMLGAIVLTWAGEGPGLDAGSLLIALACLCWGLDNNLSRKLSAVDPTQIATIKGLCAGVTNCALALALGATIPPPALIGAGAIVGFLGVGISLVLFMLALRHLGTARTGAYFALAPFVGAVLAIFALGEEPTVQIVAAGILMAIGTWFHVSERHDHEHAHGVLEHDHSHVHDDHHQHGHEGPVTEPHTHWHKHEPQRHSHPHYPDLHHRHPHEKA